MLYETLGNRRYRLAPIDHSHRVVDVDFSSDELTDEAKVSVTIMSMAFSRNLSLI